MISQSDSSPINIFTSDLMWGPLLYHYELQTISCGLKTKHQHYFYLQLQL